MKKLYVLFGICMAMSMFLFSGCKMDSDVLASYDNGKITRGEFNKWISFSKTPKEVIFGSIEEQTARLRSIAAQKLVAAEAQAAGYDKSEDFKRLNTLFKDSFTFGFYKRKLIEKGDFNEDAVSISVIKIRVKDYTIENNKNRKFTNAELTLEYEKQMERATEIIGEINKGMSFSDAANQYSDDISKKDGGNLGYITIGMHEQEVTDAAFALAEGEISKEPVKAKGAVYIIKANKKVVLTKDNIGKYIKEEKMAEELKSQFARKSVAEVQQKLLEAPDVVNNIETVNFRDKNAVVYKYDDTEMNVSAFEEYLSFTLNKLGAPKSEIAKMTDDNRREIAGMFLIGALWTKEAVKQGIDQSKEFKDEWDYFYTINLVGVYKNDNIFDDIKITREQVNVEYKKQIERIAEMNKNMPAGNRSNRTITFTDVEDMLIGQAKAEKSSAYDVAILDKSNFVINESKLEKPSSDGQQLPQGMPMMDMQN